MTGPGTYVYDGNGNPTTWSGTSLTFDVENRMTAYGTTLAAGYRGDGLRAWKNTSSGQTYFLYDGISVVCELDAGGNVIAGSTYGAAGLLSRGSVQYQFDHLGDATIRLDGGGNVLSYRLFDAWGNELSSGGEPYGYRARYGYYADSETGLIALAHRYYAPGVGRFLNRDPIRHMGGANLYAMVNNRILAASDRSGLQMGVDPGEGGPSFEEQFPPGPDLSNWQGPPTSLLHEKLNACIAQCQRKARRWAVAGCVPGFAAAPFCIQCLLATAPLDPPTGGLAASSCAALCGIGMLSCVIGAIACYWAEYNNCLDDCCRH